MGSDYDNWKTTDVRSENAARVWDEVQDMTAAEIVDRCALRGIVHSNMEELKQELVDAILEERGM